MQRELILSMTLGDGSITLGKPRGVYLSMTHSPVQRDYLDWKVGLLDTNQCLANKACTMNTFTVLSGKRFNQCKATWCDTKTLRTYREWIYPNGEKTISGILRYLNSALPLAIFFMDDGSVFKRKRKHKDGSVYYLRPSMKLCTHSYSEEDNQALLQWLKDVYGIEGYIVMERKRSRGVEYYTLNFNCDNTIKIWNLIKPYVEQVPSMKEKFKFVHDYYSNS